MQKPRRLRDKARAHDLDNIEKDPAAFIQNGGNLKKQAQYHNAVHAPIFKIPKIPLVPLTSMFYLVL